MTRPALLLLSAELVDLQRAADHLAVSAQRCCGLTQLTAPGLEELERLESFAARFARLADLLTQRMLRLIDDVELVTGGSVLDRLHRAEQRGFASATDLIRIRELRNLIAHEYAGQALHEIYSAVEALSPALLAVVPAISAYAKRLLA